MVTIWLTSNDMNKLPISHLDAKGLASQEKWMSKVEHIAHSYILVKF